MSRKGALRQVAPSPSEGGVPLVILEAFAARVPVLASQVGDTGEIITHGRNGFPLPSPEAPAIARRLRELLPQRDRLERAAQSAHRLWQEKFTAERYRSEICEIIRGVIHSRESPGGKKELL